MYANNFEIHAWVNAHSFMWSNYLKDTFVGTKFSEISDFPNFH